MDKELEMMLPEYVNGSLSTENIKRIEQAMQHDMDIKSEIAFLQQLRQIVKNEEVESPEEWGWARLKRSLPKENELEAPVAKTSSWWRPLAVAASFAFVLQTSYMLFNENKLDDGYVPLSTSELENTIQIVFDKNINESQIRDLLNSIDASIVSGPSAVGVYRITAKDRDTAIRVLKESPWIEHVEIEK
jgi:anti-sigma-K factor RskA